MARSVARVRVAETRLERRPRVRAPGRGSFLQSPLSSSCVVSELVQVPTPACVTLTDNVHRDIRRQCTIHLRLAGSCSCTLPSSWPDRWLAAETPLERRPRARAPGRGSFLQFRQFPQAVYSN